jgi:hypothetical protein
MEFHGIFPVLKQQDPNIEKILNRACAARHRKTSYNDPAMMIAIKMVDRLMSSFVRHA